MIFAREVTTPLTSLVKKVNDETSKNGAAKMGSFVVFCSDAEGLDKKLKELADKEKLDKCILSIDNPSGPKGYEVAKDADVTVVLYSKQTVAANFAFKKGELKETDV